MVEDCFLLFVRVETCLELGLAECGARRLLDMTGDEEVPGDFFGVRALFVIALGRGVLELEVDELPNLGEADGDA